MTARARFTQADITRALRGAKDAGFDRVRVGIDANGNIVVDVGNELEEIQPARKNPLDRFLAAP